jgi:hypothetical protein
LSPFVQRLWPFDSIGQNVHLDVDPLLDLDPLHDLDLFQDLDHDLLDDLDRPY